VEGYVKRWALVVFFWASLVWGFEVTLSPEEIGLNEVATLTISHSEPIESPSLPSVDGITFEYQGVSQFSSLQIINGKTTSSKSFQYSYAIIPSKTGKFTIPSFELRDKKNNVFHTDPLVLRVTKQRVQISKPSVGVDFVLPRIFYVLEPNKTAAKQNEAVVLTGYFVSDQREALNYPLQTVRSLLADNCIIYDTTAFLTPSVRQKNGFWYKAVHQWIVFGVEAGALPIAPPQLIAISPVGQVSVPTENIVLDIRKTPRFVYLGFLEGNASLSSTTITQGDSVTYTLSLKGNGNLILFSDPLRGIVLSNVDISPVQISHILTNEDNRIIFLQRLSYKITPLKPGNYEIPPLSLVYQDEQGRDRVLNLPSHRIEVKESTFSLENFSPLPVKSKHLVRYAGGSPVFWFFLLGSILFPWGFWFWRQHEKRLASDPTYARYLSSLTQMEKYFADAKNSQDNKVFAQNLYKALISFIVDREKLPKNMPLYAMMQALKEKRWTQEELDVLSQILSSLEEAAYAPVSSEGEKQAMFERTLQLLKEHYRIL